MAAWVFSLHPEGKREGFRVHMRGAVPVVRADARFIPVTDELVDAGIVHGGVGLGQLPHGPLDAVLGRGVYLTDNPLLPLEGQAQFYRQRLQSPVVLQQQDGSGGVDSVVRGVDAFEVGHESIVMVQDEELLLLQGLKNRHSQTEESA